MAYSRKISVMKSGGGAIDGIIAAAVAGIVIAFLKTKITNLTPELENTVTVAVGAVVSAVVIGAKRYVENWLKHREIPLKVPTK